jgi:putative Mn2+ efflux pump MntP
LQVAETVLIAVALGCDAFAVGMGVGTRFCGPRQVFRLSFHFGLFQFLMPLLGWTIGMNAFGVVRQCGPWLAFGLLFFIGARMTYESFHPDEASTDQECKDPTRGMSLVMLSVATSMDALGVGFSIGVLGQSLLAAAICIGITACAMTWTAMKVGSRLSSRFGQRMETAGGIILMAIAVKLLVA